MSVPSRSRVKVVSSSSRAEVRLNADQLAAAADVSARMLARLVGLGLLEPLEPDGREFGADTAARLRRMLRLRRDLGVNLTGAAVIVDLLQRLERLESELARLRGGA
jgi:DNA-binding transcriptional MerR regulator